MQFHYPKFLKVSPLFMGLSLVDLGLVTFILFFVTIFGLEAHWALIMILVGLGIFKLITLKLPRLSFEMMSRRSKKLNWSYALEKVSKNNKWTDSL